MTRTFIYGSCVSRDTFEFLPSSNFELVTYVARQSLVSVYSHLPRDAFPALQFTSPFQRRMVEGDWVSSLAPLLHEKAAGIDLFLWDLFDERLGVYQLASGHYVTESIDGIQSGLQSHLRQLGADLIPFGSPRHLEEFSARLPHFKKLLARLDLLDRTVVLAPAWAERFEDGEPTPKSFDLAPVKANDIYRAYYENIRTIMNVPVLSLPPQDTRADPQHKWGPAPFHYTVGTYTQLSDLITSTTPRPR